VGRQSLEVVSTFEVKRLRAALRVALWLGWLQNSWCGDTIQMPAADILQLVAAGICNIRLQVALRGAVASRCHTLASRPRAKDNEDEAALQRNRAP
jgi:hypothetical protein